MKLTKLIKLSLLVSVLAVMSVQGESINKTENSEMQQTITIEANSQTFTATLADNRTSKALLKLLPLTLTMLELNANEKYAELSESLPTEPFTPAQIEVGDLLLYGNDTLVLFYKSFTTPYRYSRIGKVDNPAGLATVLGTGDVTVTFTQK